MPAVPFAKTGTAPEDTAWNFNSSTSNAVLGDDNWSRYKQAHAWWDGSSGDDAKKKSAYKLPHHRMGDSGLEAVWHGVSNAMARLNQTDMPESEMKSVFNHLAKHYAQWDKEAPDWKRFWAQAQERRKPHATLPLGTTRALILADRPMGAPTDEDMSYIRQQMRSDTLADPDKLYVFPALISDQQVDSYYTRMTTQSLRNFAQQATQGVSVCDSHNHYQMPIGRSFYGSVNDTPNNGMNTQSLAYLIRGMQLPGNMKSDDYILALEGGLYHDVSIGFDPERYWCTICGLDMLNNYDCNHYPGRTYDTDDNGPQMCIADVDANLVEYSPVYKGANPGSHIMPNGRSLDDDREFGNILVLKADVEVQRGRATAKDLTFVEDHCHVRLYQRYHGWKPTESPSQTYQYIPGKIDTFVPQFQVGVSNSTSLLSAQGTQPMSGEEFVRALIAKVTDSAQRSGKAISKPNMDKLNAVQAKMAAGHGTMADAMGELAEFITAYGVTPDPDNDGDVDTGPQGSTDDPDNDGTSSGGKSGTYGAGAQTTSDGSQEYADTPEYASGDYYDGSSGSSTSGGGDYTGASGGPTSDQGVGSGGRAHRQPQSRLTAEERDALVFAQRMREEAIEDALRSGARAHGKDFNTERYRAILSRASYDDIKGFRADWNRVAAAQLSPKGHQTHNGGWTTEPTMRGERQTAAQSPNDPVGLGVNRNQPPTEKIYRNLHKA